MTGCGLANRLLTIASGLRVGERLHRPVHVNWPLEWHMRPPFRRIIDCEIPESNLKNTVYVACNNLLRGSRNNINRAIRTQNFSVINLPGDNKKRPDFSPYLQQLQPHLHVRRKIQSFLAKHDNFENVIGIHVRKGDKRDGNNQYVVNLDKQYFQVMRILQEQWPTKKFFMASDEGVGVFAKRFPGRIIRYPRRSSYWQASRMRWLSDVEDAFIDMILLSKTEMVVFGIGSFGFCGALMSNVKRINIITAKQGIVGFANNAPKPLPPRAVMDKILGINRPAFI